MPEGHTVHRLAHAFRELFGGRRLEVGSPQGRFADGAALLDGQVLVATEAHGKHLFLAFAPEARDDVAVLAETAAAAPESPDAALHDDGVRWLRVHLGLYGSWRFAGDETFHAPHAIGAPRRRVGEEETAIALSPDEAFEGVEEVSADDGAGSPTPRPAAAGEALHAAGLVARPEAVTAPATATATAWRVPAPRGAVRVRLLGEHGVADLTGPTACEVVTADEKATVHARLGPDPLRADGDREAFVRGVRKRRRTVGELLMDQSVIAGVGNIYRAEALYRSRVHPLRLGQDVSVAKLHAIWDDLAVLMADGVTTGRIITTRPEDRQDPEDRWYVYHRSGWPCLVCGTKVAEAPMAGRRLFWCPRCQRAPRP
ncbi:Fpg/Nei family DNA glycosylase [Georgenia yuyongxinii]|uniref:DNA-(apurinic or apyrimidinic site) lyase n=1 Tax=Georgenia yuyongxinii TaxID=2589797 RepID=A0A552WM38_9MICO|nr:DNA-formamidopyrimidine glycosylase family protein [Georgenia yuyongxinii]TRW43816.1 Fpg/Nei family DNA glycosylase [Georgenia yuyongxinii]